MDDRQRERGKTVPSGARGRRRIFLREMKIERDTRTQRERADKVGFGGRRGRDGKFLRGERQIEITRDEDG